MNDYYKSRYTYDKRRERVWEVICGYIQKYIPENSIIVDVGAGYCSFINTIIAKEKYAVDTYEGFVKFANPDVRTFIGSSTNLSFLESNFFDIVFSSNLLEHLSTEDISKSLDEFFRILKPNGKLILLLPNFKYCYKVFYDDYTHKTPLTDNAISDMLLEKNFRIDVLKPNFLPFSFKSKLPINKILVWLYIFSPFKPLAGQMLIVATKE